MHGPQQAEIASLKSLNTEVHERMFNSIKSVGKSCTNRQPAFVMPRLLQCLHTKRIDTEHYKVSRTALKEQDDCVSCEAKQLPPFAGMSFSETFIKARLSSFQAHLECISRYLECGPGIWWEKVDGTITFFDGDHHPDMYKSGPIM